VVLLDIGPRSLHVEWPSSALPQDNGGAKLQHVRISALLVQDSRLILTVYSIASADDGHIILTGLRKNASYRIRVEFANRIGTICYILILVQSFLVHCTCLSAK